ncbi:pyruvate formate lyase activating enzyme [Pilibacter termitis]|uniref:Pyruvate formate lyase activating enzyme n=1 Tax=Pilibacter termitis TaxID=263852 RepID=A0A1T4K0U1_9ENTE|nr:glycyl-radical enzyme activating protein [Pilibacter termitis]SJZ35895.1 pyruvate formate lyase activating enzyme [Pilibacter termitis]
MEIHGLVFNIQRYSIHDGAGIRTIVFLKGCPLACPWCANPESRKEVAPIVWNKNGKSETIGTWYSVEELTKEILKDEIFFRASGGGVTLSGGEVLMQSEFAKEFLSEMKSLGIHTAIETTGCFPKDRLANLLPYVEQLLFDLKIFDKALSKKVIGSDIQLIKENFELANSFNETVELLPRIPLIPEYTTSQENLLSIRNYLIEQKINELHLLPFHQYGSSKYEYLGWEYKMKDTKLLETAEIQAIKELFEKANFTVNIEGLG